MSTTPDVVAEAPQKWVPKAYMVKAVRWLLSHAGAGLFLDPGLGKTSIVLQALSVLKEEGYLRKGALVIAPLRPLYNVWDSNNPDSEPRKWTNFHHFKIVMLHGDDKDKALREKADIYLINPDGLRWLFTKVNASRFDVLVVDESTMFKHISTQRFKTSAQLPAGILAPLDSHWHAFAERADGFVRANLHLRPWQRARQVHHALSAHLLQSDRVRRLYLGAAGWRRGENLQAHRAADPAHERRGLPEAPSADRSARARQDEAEPDEDRAAAGCAQGLQPARDFIFH
jgi:hypothetical protein